MLAVAIPLGLLIGLSLGALGGGGSILTVPALVYLLGQSAHAATTGSLLIVGVTALAGMTAHWRAGRVRVAQGLIFGTLGVAGSYAGTKLSADVDPHVLLTAFAGLMLVAAAAMLLRARGRGQSQAREPARNEAAPSAVAEDALAAGGPALPAATCSFGPSAGQGVAILDRRVTRAATCALPSPSPRFSTCRAIKVVAAATAVGLLTGFFGVGGGFVIVPALVLALGFEMPVAVGTSLLVIAVNSAVALASRLGGHAHFDWPLLAVFTVAAVAGSVGGNRVASRVDARRLTGAFTLLLVGVAAYTALRSVPHLV